MSMLIVYDSLYGNTESIAMAIADGLGGDRVVRLMRASDALRPEPRSIELLLVGGPTQRHGPSPPLRAFLEALARGSLQGIPVATFDTRYRLSPLLTGSAADYANRRLRRAGGRAIASPESFLMAPDVPPKGEKRRHEWEKLELGEVERARAWGRTLLARLGEHRLEEVASA